MGLQNRFYMEFRKRDGRAQQFVELLRTIAEIPPDQEPILKEVLEAIREFRVADMFIPAGSQVLRFRRAAGPEAPGRRPALLRGRVLRAARRFRAGP